VLGPEDNPTKSAVCAACITAGSSTDLQALEGGLDNAHASFLRNENLGDTKPIRNRDRAPRVTAATLMVDAGLAVM